MQRKYQQNEIHSLIYEEGLPMFFITFASCDFKSPICLYFVGSKIDLSEYCPRLPNYQDSLHIISANPITCSCFFSSDSSALCEDYFACGHEPGGFV